MKNYSRDSINKDEEFLIKTFITDQRFKTNTYLIICKYTNEGFVIDPSDGCQELIDYIENNLIKVKYIINTHCHPDHCSGNYKIFNKFNAVLLISEKEEKLLNSLLAAGFIKKYHVPYEFIKEKDIYEIGKIKVSILETEGHTKGSISVVCGNIIFCGDLIINAFEKELDNACKATIQEKILPIENEELILYPGHGIPMGKAFVRKIIET